METTRNQITPTPGKLAYDAYCSKRQWKSFNGQPLPQFDAQSLELKEAWEAGATATRAPLAKLLYEARHAIARLLVTYRDRLFGNWYEFTAKDTGLELDEIGFIKGPYKHDEADSPAGQREIQRLANGEKDTTTDVPHRSAPEPLPRKTAVADIKVEVKKLEIKSGDILVITVPEDQKMYRQKILEETCRQLSRTYSDLHVFVVTDRFSFERNSEVIVEAIKKSPANPKTT